LNKKFELIKRIANTEYSSIVKYSFRLNYKLRIILIDESFIDVNISSTLKEKFGFHWETKNKFNDIYRFDNFPDVKWNYLKSFPFHFHFKQQDYVIEPPFPKELAAGFRGFMDFVKTQISP
jgi:hypothetical protein